MATEPEEPTTTGDADVGPPTGDSAADDANRLDYDQATAMLADLVGHDVLVGIAVMSTEPAGLAHMSGVLLGPPADRPALVDAWRVVPHGLISQHLPESGFELDKARFEWASRDGEGEPVYLFMADHVFIVVDPRPRSNDRPPRRKAERRDPDAVTLAALGYYGGAMLRSELERQISSSVGGQPAAAKAVDSAISAGDVVELYGLAPFVCAPGASIVVASDVRDVAAFRGELDAERGGWSGWGAPPRSGDEGSPDE